MESRARGIGWAAPASLFFLALAVRLVGIRWGLPNAEHTFSYHPDESLLLAVAQRLDVLHGVWDPQFYNYGAGYLYLLYLARLVVDGYTTFTQSTPEWQQVGAYLFAGRLMNCLFGAGVAAVGFAIGARVVGASAPRRLALLAGVTAGVTLAIAPAMAVHSRFQTVDVPALFFLTVALLYSLKAMQDGGRRLIRCAFSGGLMVGLAAGVKYSAGLGIMAVTLGIILSSSKPAKKLGAALAAISAAAVGFVITTPGVVFNSRKFLEDLAFERRHMADASFDLTFQQTPSGWLYHVSPNLTAGFGALLLAVCAAGLLIGVARKNREIIVLAVFGLVYYALIGSFQAKFLRYTFPLYPVLAAGGAYLCAVGELRKWGQMAVGAGIAWSSVAVATYTLYMARPDPRDRAGDWLRTRLNASIGVPTVPWFYSPPLYPLTNLPGPPQARLDANTRPRLSVAVPDWNVELVTVARPDHVIITQFEEYDPKRLGLPAYAEFMDALRVDYRWNRAWGADVSLPHDLLYIQPKVTVWTRR